MGEYVSSYTGKKIDELLGIIDQNDFALADHTHDSQNTIMWEGAEYMNTDNAVSFMYGKNEGEEPHKVSEQPHGIILVFSYFDKDAETPVVKDHSWSCHFVPKVMVELNNGGAHTFLMAYNSTLATFGAKHIKISDTGMTGYEANGMSSTAQCGIKFSNDNYVLRYVIGV